MGCGIIDFLEWIFCGGIKEGGSLFFLAGLGVWKVKEGLMLVVVFSWCFKSKKLYAFCYAINKR